MAVNIAYQFWYSLFFAIFLEVLTSDYVRDLIRHDQMRKDKIAHMQALVTEAFEGGVSDKSMDDILKQARGSGAS